MKATKIINVNPVINHFLKQKIWYDGNKTYGLKLINIFFSTLLLRDKHASTSQNNTYFSTPSTLKTHQIYAKKFVLLTVLCGFLLGVVVIVSIGPASVSAVWPLSTKSI